MDIDYKLNHEALLRKALVRLGIWQDPAQALPNPEDLKQGVEGHSFVYFVYIPFKDGVGRLLAAKFDDPERSSVEWKAIKELRCLDNPPEVILPLESNQPEDEVIIFRAAEGMSGNMKCLSFLDLFKSQAETNPRNCSLALEKLFAALNRYYQSEPGAARVASESSLNRWRNAYPKINRKEALDLVYEAAYAHWPGVDWHADEAFSLSGADRSLPNPLKLIQALLSESTGPVILSRVHGDLNLTNIMVALEASRNVDRIFVIDVTNSSPNQVLAVDFAKVETEIWRQLTRFSNLDLNVLEEKFVRSRDFLDGRLRDFPEQLAGQVLGTTQIVNHLRQFARSYLNPFRNPRARYLLEDYVRCLLFSSVNTLRFLDVRSSNATSRIMILSAALSLEFMREVDAGLYSRRPGRQRWAPPRQIRKSRERRSVSQAAVKDGPTPLLVHPYPMQANFTGRTQERALFSDWWRFGQEPLFVLTSIGGMGKSAAAWAWLLRDVLDKDIPGANIESLSRCSVPGGEGPEGVFWWSFYELGATFNAFLDRVLEYLMPQEALKAGKVETLLMLLQRKHCLLVLDGFERELVAYSSFRGVYLDDDSEICPEHRDCLDPLATEFLRGAVALPLRSKILLTGRLFPRSLEGHDSLPLGGCRHVPLEGLNNEEAINFFKAQGINASAADIEEVSLVYGGHPLTLRLLSGLILHDRENPGDITTALSYNPVASLKQRRQHVLENAYNSLHQEVQGLLSRIACFRFSAHFKAVLAAFPGKESTWVHQGLQALEDRGLLFVGHARAHYSLHPIVRIYAYSRLMNSQQIHGLLSRYFESLPMPGHVSSIEDVAALIERYDHTLRAGHPDEAWKLFPDLIEKFLYYRLGEYQSVIDLMKGLLPYGEEGMPVLSNPLDQGDCLSIIGVVRTRMGQPNRAIALHKRALELYRVAGAMRDVAISFGNLSSDYIKIGQLKEAYDALLERIKVAQDADIIKSEMTARQELGRLLIYRGLYGDALNQLERARDHWREEGNPHGISLTEAFLALRALFLDDATNALRHAREARNNAELERNIVQSEWLIGSAMTVLAASEGTNSLLFEAEEHLSEAMRRCRRVRLVEFESEILLSLAKVDLARVRYEEAFLNAQESLSLAEQCCYRLQQAEAHLFLAELALTHERPDIALEEGRSAIYHALCDGEPYSYKKVWTLGQVLVARVNGIRNAS